MGMVFNATTDQSHADQMFLPGRSAPALLTDSAAPVKALAPRTTHSPRLVCTTSDDHGVADHLSLQHTIPPQPDHHLCTCD